VLWTDSKGEWRSLIPKLRERLPELLILGEYDPGASMISYRILAIF